ncbi:GMC oxidoreductase [Bradyrhizobium sp. TZ2]
MPACGILRATPGAPCFIASAPAGWGATAGRCSIRNVRVRGVEKLRVVDASVMPQITSANTNATTLMIGSGARRL